MLNPKASVYDVTVRNGEKVETHSVLLPSLEAAVRAVQLQVIEAGAAPGTLNGEIVEAKFARHIHIDSIPDNEV